MTEEGRGRRGAVVSVRDVESAAKNGRALVVTRGTVVTPAARERAAELNVAIRVQRDKLPPLALALPSTEPAGDLIEPLAAFVLAAASQPLPEEVIDRVKLLLVDSLAAGIAGVRVEAVRALAEALAARRHGERGHLIGLRQKLAPTEAALVNGALISALEYDARFGRGALAPMSGPVAATLAVADELRLRDPRNLLPAIAVGAEVACRVAAGTEGPPILSRAAALAALGGVAAAGVLLGLEFEALVSAFGLAFTQALAPAEHLAELGPLLPGLGAQAAVQALRLAAGGVSGPRGVLDGPAGYARLVEGGRFDRTKVLEGLGAEWMLEEVAVRLFPVEPVLAAAVEGAVQLRDDRLLPARLQQILVEASEAVVSVGGGRPRPGASLAELRRSLRYLVAVALRHGWVGLSAVATSATLDRDLWDLMERIEVAISPEIPSDSLTPVRLVALTSDGLLLETVIETMPGDLGQEVTRHRLRRKLADCWYWSGQPPYRRPLRIADAVDALDRAQSLSTFWSAVSPQAAL